MMKLGLFLAGPGQHIASWRDPAVDVGRQPEPAALRRRSRRLAERALFDFVFNADTQFDLRPRRHRHLEAQHGQRMRIEPMTLLGALAAVTQRIGLISTATTTYLDPFHVARMFASLDQLSEGRSAGTW